MYRPSRSWLSPFALFVSASFFIAGCNRGDSPRHYDEVAFRPLGQNPAAQAMNASPMDIDLDWKVPAHWIMKDSANSMRAGSFGIPDSAVMNTGELNPDAVDVSITHFAGDAGGMKSNIQRWMGQVGLKVDSLGMEDFLAKAGKFTTQSGEEGWTIDLTTLLSGDVTQDKTIIGAIIPARGFTLFVKAMGERSRVVAARRDIQNFCESLVLKAEGP